MLRESTVSLCDDAPKFTAHLRELAYVRLTVRSHRCRGCCQQLSTNDGGRASNERFSASRTPDDIPSPIHGGIAWAASPARKMRPTRHLAANARGGCT